MDAAAWERRKDILGRAMELGEAERASFIESESANDVELAADLRSLLIHVETPDPRFDDFLSWNPFGEPGAGADLTGVGVSEGTTVGRYRVLRLIASGGMSDVYEADQDYPARSVALKLLRPTHPLMDGEVLRRFELEASMQGMLKHPGIAQVYDAGVAELGAMGERPFLAMELIDGESLLDHAEGKRSGNPAAPLNLRERLQLLVRICEAAGHAHERGIIHRDLKPSNILVDRFGQPKLIDFGIARISRDAEEDARTMMTRAGEVLGTVGYMSPEQLAGDAAGVTTRSDVYSLGVIAYRLLTGEYPYGRMKDVATAAEAIRLREPDAPSGHKRELRGDLDAIILKAIEKAPERRYATASAMGEDISRYLRNEPIEAKPISGLERARKFVKRNRGLVVASASVILALTVGLAIASFEAVQAYQAQKRAEKRAEDLRALITGFRAVEGRLSTISGTLESRWEILKPLLGPLERLGSEGVDDPRLAVELAILNMRVAEVRGGLSHLNYGERGVAEQSYRRARRLLDGALGRLGPTRELMDMRQQLTSELGMLIAYSHPAPTGPIEGFGVVREQADRAKEWSRREPDNLDAWDFASAGAAEVIRISEFVGPRCTAESFEDWSGCLEPPARKPESEEEISRVALGVFRRAVALGRVESARERMGIREDLATPAFAEAERALELALDASPGDLNLELTLADVFRYRGELAMRQRRFGIAAECYGDASRRYCGIAVEHGDLAGAWMMTCLAGREHAGALVEAGDFGAARGAALQAASIALDLVRRDPLDTRVRGILGDTIAVLVRADIALAAGVKDEAERARILGEASSLLDLGEELILLQVEAGSDGGSSSADWQETAELRARIRRSGGPRGQAGA